ncbi:hypothetical protein C0585_07215 [Candidatus Woesearchaeota archaeon]|nr:MAG: hypothetical protein C0585_07215 [Candidatus Woesearchaeota archaeon]
MIEYLLLCALGILAGTVTGLIPGIHINLLSVLIVSFSAYLLEFVDGLSLGVFVMSMSVTHTFLDSIPSIFLGCPDADQALGVLPGHKLLLRGFGFGAVHLTLIGSLFGLIFSIALFPILINIVFIIYPLIKNLIGWMLVIVVTYMIFREKNRLTAGLIFLYSGILGLIILNIPNLNNPLFPLLSGLFGVSSLILSLNDKVKIPMQRFSKLKLKKSVLVRAVSASGFAGFLTSFMPGLGPAQGAVVAQSISGKIGDKGFLVLIGGLNTVNMILSLVTFYVLDKARNGSVIALSKLIEIDVSSIIIILISILFAGIISFFWAQILTRFFSHIVENINYVVLSSTIIFLIFLLTIFLSGWVGLVVLFTASFAGLLAPLNNVSRSHAMGCLMLPVIIYFLL